MRNSSFLTLFLLFFSLSVSAQNTKPELSKNEGILFFMFPPSFDINNESATASEVEDLLEGNEEALNALRKYKRKSGFRLGLTFAGSLAASYPIYKGLFGGEPDYTYFAAGGAVIILSSLLLDSGINKSIDEVISLYNGQTNPNGAATAKLSFGMQGLGLGLKLSF